MPPIRAHVAPLDLLSDRWLIEALSQLSSNPHVRAAATTWLAVYWAELRRGCAEDVAQARADEEIKRVVGPEGRQVQADANSPDQAGWLLGGQTGDDSAS